MDAIKTAIEAMFAAKDWASFVEVIRAVLAEIFGYVANEEGWNA